MTIFAIRRARMSIETFPFDLWLVFSQSIGTNLSLSPIQEDFASIHRRFSHLYDDDRRYFYDPMIDL